MQTSSPRSPGGFQQECRSPARFGARRRRGTATATAACNGSLVNVRRCGSSSQFRKKRRVWPAGRSRNDVTGFRHRGRWLVKPEVTLLASTVPVAPGGLPNRCLLRDRRTVVRPVAGCVALRRLRGRRHRRTSHTHSHRSCTASLLDFRAPDHGRSTRDRRRIYLLPRRTQLR